MGKDKVDRLHGDLTRLENIQRVLLSAHAGVIPDGYVNVLVEEIKFLWESVGKTKAKPKHVPTLREQSNKFIPHKNPKKKNPEGWDA